MLDDWSEQARLVCTENTHRIVLRSISGAGTVQSNDLVTEDIVSGCNIAGDSDRPGVVVSDQGIRGPGAGHRGIRDQPRPVDLEPFEGCLVDSCAVSAAVSKVVDDWPVMAGWPGSPLHLDDTASSHVGVCLSVRGSSVADDVRGSVCVGRDESVGLILGCIPSGNDWLLASTKVLEVGIVTFVAMSC